MGKTVDLTLDMIMKMSPEDFITTMKNQTKGFKESLANLLKVQFEQCRVSKDVITDMLANGRVPQEDLVQTNRTLEDLYLCLQLLEDRYTILNILISEDR